MGFLKTPFSLRIAPVLLLKTWPLASVSLKKRGLTSESLWWPILFTRSVQVSLWDDWNTWSKYRFENSLLLSPIGLDPRNGWASLLLLEMARCFLSFSISALALFTSHKTDWCHFQHLKKEAGTKVLASQLFLDCRARRSGWVGSTTLISSAFTALLNCAEVGRRNRILTNYRFLSHSLLKYCIR